MSSTTNESDQTLDELDSRALQERMTVLDDAGRARDAPGLYIVISGSGSEYLVDMHQESCECPDNIYRNRRGKHIRRVEFATGRRVIPQWVDRSKIDPLLGQHVSGPVFAPKHTKESPTTDPAPNPDSVPGL